MDEKALSIFNNIYTRFLSKLSRYQQSVVVNCLIDIRKIYTENINNCNINIMNKCLANIESTFKILNESIAEELFLLNNDLRKSIEESLNITAKEINNGVNKGYIATCSADATVDANVNINELIIKNCYSINNTPLNFVFLNSGSASANCGIAYLNNALSDIKTENINEERYLKFFLYLTYIDYTYLIFIFFGILLCGFIILLLINKKVFLNFKSIKFYM
jgi:hypothetical protein